MFYSLLGILLCTCALIAEQIDNIEFTLPENSLGWEISYNIENKYGSALVFNPKEDLEAYAYHPLCPYSGEYEYDESNQSFQATFHKIPYDSEIDAEKIEAQSALLIPSISYQFYLVEQTEDFAILEFYAFNLFGFTIYGVMGKIRSANGTVTLTYTTAEEAQIPQMRRLGLSALKKHRALEL